MCELTKVILCSFGCLEPWRWDK